MTAKKNNGLKVELQQSISSQIAHHFRIIPKSVDKLRNVFFIDRKKKEKIPSIKKELELILDKKIELELKESDYINKLLSTSYRKNVASSKTLNYKSDYLHNLVLEAKEIQASDIHIEIYNEKVRVRLRIDGQLIEKNHIKKENYLELINQIKIKANLDITEKRLPQDGRIEYNEFDVRVSVIPTHHGEKVVMRILGRDASHLELSNLGFDTEDRKCYEEAVKKSNGIILISGPTGSGKTTTLYATLKKLNEINRNIVTVENPIEYTLEGINQVQLNEKIGLTFSKALKSFLRQDPDIIMLGEIRDKETANMAIRASLTGHLVLSTVHTNSAIGTISRMIDMGVPSFLLAETLNISVAQRLVRLLCNDCKQATSFSEKELPSSFEPRIHISKHFIPIGCNNCYHTGYKGRKAIYELLKISKETTEAIKNNKLSKIKNTDDLSLSNKAFQLIVNGKTSLEEVYPILI